MPVHSTVRRFLIIQILYIFYVYIEVVGTDLLASVFTGYVMIADDHAC